MSLLTAYASLVTSLVSWSRTSSTSERFSATATAVQIAVAPRYARQHHEPVPIARVFETWTQHQCYSHAALTYKTDFELAMIMLGIATGVLIVAAFQFAGLWVLEADLITRIGSSFQPSF